MVAVNLGRLLRGPSFVYIGAAGDAEWTINSTGDPTGDGFSLLASGLLAPEGVSITLDQDINELSVAANVAPIEAFRNGGGATITFTAYDLSPSTLAQYTGNTATNTRVSLTQSRSVSKFALLIVGQSPRDSAKFSAWWFPRAYVQSLGEVRAGSYSQVLQVALTCRALHDENRNALGAYSIQS